MMDKNEMTVAEYLQRIDKRQQNIESTLLSQKNVLTFNEAARYMGVSNSELYKRTHLRTIPHFKPRNKMIYFDRVELENYLKQNPIQTTDEIEAQANTYVALNNRRGSK